MVVISKDKIGARCQSFLVISHIMSSWGETFPKFCFRFLSLSHQIIRGWTLKDQNGAVLVPHQSGRGPDKPNISRMLFVIMIKWRCITTSKIRLGLEVIYYSPWWWWGWWCWYCWWPRPKGLRGIIFSIMMVVMVMLVLLVASGPSWHNLLNFRPTLSAVS